jgi:catechol 2,3-dioxygenase-like lactoylglutathione lyase family enzyme
LPAPLGVKQPETAHFGRSVGSVWWQQIKREALKRPSIWPMIAKSQTLECSEMLFYVTLGTNNPDAAKKFYDEVLATIDYVRHVDGQTGYGYGPAKHKAAELQNRCNIWVEKPYMNLPATWGNGSMIALTASSHEAVNAFHAAALANGGYDEGAPGLRHYGPNFYACYVRDPDGNKLSAVCEV